MNPRQDPTYVMAVIVASTPVIEPGTSRAKKHKLLQHDLILKSQYSLCDRRTVSHPLWIRHRWGHVTHTSVLHTHNLSTSTELTPGNPATASFTESLKNHLVYTHYHICIISWVTYLPTNIDHINTLAWRGRRQSYGEECMRFKGILHTMQAFVCLFLYLTIVTNASGTHRKWEYLCTECLPVYLYQHTLFFQCTSVSFRVTAKVESPQLYPPPFNMQPYSGKNNQPHCNGLACPEFWRPYPHLV